MLKFFNIGINNTVLQNNLEANFVNIVIITFIKPQLKINKNVQNFD